MRFNEVLLIGGALLAASLVFSKGGESQQNLQTLLSNSKVNLLSNQNANTKPLEKINTYPQKINLPILETFKQFFPVTNTNVQLKKIIDIEKEERDERVSYLQNELDQTKGFIEKQYGIVNFRKVYNKYDKKKGYLYDSDVQRISNLTGKEKGDYTSKDVINYYENLVQSEAALGYGGNVTGGAFRKFPKVTAALTNYYNQLVVRVNAQESIKPAEIYADQQQQGINKVLNEYTTRFGGLSRYD